MTGTWITTQNFFKRKSSEIQQVLSALILLSQTGDFKLKHSQTGDFSLLLYIKITLFP